MSYWAHNPELYEEIIYNRMVSEGLATGEEEDPAEVVNEFMEQPNSWKLAIDAERDYWSDMADVADSAREAAEDR